MTSNIAKEEKSIKKNTAPVTDHIAFKLIATISTISTIVFFVLGHLYAREYYTEWNIPYYKLTTPSTAFTFLLESWDFVLLTILLNILSLLTLYFFLHLLTKIFKFFKPLIDREKQEINGILIKLKKITVLFCIFTALSWLVSEKLRNSVSSQPLREQILKKNYVPFEVGVEKAGTVYKCVTPLGSLGAYNVFINELQQPLLIPTNKITYIKPMLLNPPQKINGEQTRSYNKDRNLWLNLWERECAAYRESLSFTMF